MYAPDVQKYYIIIIIFPPCSVFTNLAVLCFIEPQANSLLVVRSHGEIIYINLQVRVFHFDKRIVNHQGDGSYEKNIAITMVNDKRFCVVEGQNT